ncbi:MAG: hypoxanthine phosphoribosyltransferase [Caldilineaceae bacterium]|nr:hypoxanthine phosphoribosyltransferase [Caldilineaceae bacterium]
MAIDSTHGIQITHPSPVRPGDGALDKDIAHVLIDADMLRNRISELGQFIDERYAGEDLLLVAVLKGSAVFLADLMRSIHIPHEIDFMATSSYGAGVQSSGVVRILKDLNKPIENRHVLLVEDIIDSGHTLAYLTRILAARNPASLRIVTLLDKPERREVEIAVDWTGFSIPNEFVIGYGLDYDEKYRNLPYIGVLKPHVYTPDTANEPEFGSA